MRSAFVWGTASVLLALGVVSTAAATAAVPAPAPTSRLSAGEVAAAGSAPSADAVQRAAVESSVGPATRGTAGAATAGAAVQAAPPIAPYDAVTLERPDLLQGPNQPTRAYTPANGTVELTAHRNGGVQLTASSVHGGGWMTILLFPPQGQSRFTAGRRYDVGVWSTQHALLSVGVDSGGCTELGGWVDVLEVEHDGSGRVTTLAVDYAPSCEPGGAPQQRGSIRWRSTVGYVGVDVSRLDVGAVDVGTTTAPRAVTLTNLGTQTISVGSVGIADADPYPSVGTASITADECAGRVLVSGAACRVWVAVSSFEPGSARHQVEFAVPELLGSFARASVTANFAMDSTGTFVPVGPTRLKDTRYGAPVGPGGVVTVHMSWEVPACCVSAVVLNVTAVSPTASTWLTVHPTGSPVPSTSNLNLVPGEVRAGSVTVGVGQDGAVDVMNAAGSTHVVVDLLGYYSSEQGAQGGTFHVDPQRVYDSRTEEPWQEDEVAWVPVGTTGIDPEAITAVAMNVTVVEPSADGWISVYPGTDDETLPSSSSVNFRAGRTTPNLVVVPVVHIEGEPYVAVHNAVGTAHIVFDVQGWFDDGTLDGLRFKPSAPTRIVDTRVGTGGPAGALGPWSERRVLVGTATDPVGAVVANMTGVSPTSSTWLGTTPGGGVPSTSVLNLGAGETRPNALVAPLQGGGFSAFNATGSTHLLVDVFGTFS